MRPPPSRTFWRRSGTCCATRLFALTCRDFSPMQLRIMTFTRDWSLTPLLRSIPLTQETHHDDRTQNNLCPDRDFRGIAGASFAGIPRWLRRGPKEEHGLLYIGQA